MLLKKPLKALHYYWCECYGRLSFREVIADFLGTDIRVAVLKHDGLVQGGVESVSQNQGQLVRTSLEQTAPESWNAFQDSEDFSGFKRQCLFSWLRL